MTFEDMENHVCKVHRCGGCEAKVLLKEIEDHISRCFRHDKQLRGMCTVAAQCDDNISEDSLAC